MFFLIKIQMVNFRYNTVSCTDLEIRTFEKRMGPRLNTAEFNKHKPVFRAD